MKSRVAVMLLLLVGAAIGFISTKGFSTTRAASAPATTWEYLIVDTGSSNAETKDLNRLGAEGWELVTVTYGGQRTFIFKRPR